MVIVLLLRIRVGKRWGLGTIRSDTLRWIETFSAKSNKNQTGGAAGGGSREVDPGDFGGFGDMKYADCIQMSTFRPEFLSSAF